jgi:hypothetical protein
MGLATLLSMAIFLGIVAGEMPKTTTLPLLGKNIIEYFIQSRKQCVNFRFLCVSRAAFMHSWCWNCNVDNSSASKSDNQGFASSQLADYDHIFQFQKVYETGEEVKYDELHR